MGKGCCPTNVPESVDLKFQIFEGKIGAKRRLFLNTDVIGALILKQTKF